MVTVEEALKFTEEACKKIGYNIRSLPQPLQVVSLINWIEFETVLGGTYGWLINMGEYGPDTVKAFETIGAHQCATIVREILAFFPQGMPSAEDQERVRQMMAVEDDANSHWGDLGDRLLRWPDDVHSLLQQFINKHEADFT